MTKEWIPSSDKLPELRQNILATINEHGRPTVVACWFVGDNRIKMDPSPNAKTYDFSIVKAWIPFPTPYMELEPN